MVQKELQVMKDMGIITPSTSEWAASIVLVPKKDGTTRFCVDYRGLNRVAWFDAYPMLRVDNIIDLTRGYWQVPLKEHSREKTAFTTLLNYEFATMPFRLHGAVATFQHMVDQVLHGTGDFVAAFLDDLVVFSTTWEKHTKHLRETLRRLRDATYM